MTMNLRASQSARIFGQFKRFKATAVELPLEPTEFRSAEWNEAKPFDQIPGAKPWPLIGTLWQFFPFVGHKFRDQGNQLQLAQQRVDLYGRISKDVTPGWPPLVWTTRPEDAETLFRTEGKFPIRMGLQTMAKHRQQRIEYLKAGGLLIDNGDLWWRIRSKAHQPLLKTKNLKNYLPAIGQIADEFVERIRLIRPDNNEMTSDFANEMHRWALESVAVVALNTRLGCLSPNLAEDSEAQKMIRAVNTSFKNMAELELGVPIWRFIKTPKLKELYAAQDFFIETSFKYIKKTMEKIDNRPENSEEDPTILEEFLARGMTPEDTVIMVIDMLMAGIDTTSHSSSFLFYLLAKNPEKQQKLRNEIFQVVGRRGSPVTASAVNELHYLKACVKETLRLMPVIFGNQRVIDKDIVLSGYQIPKGTLVITTHEWMCRQEEYFPKPNEFIPERWIKGHPLESKTSPYVMLPFGFGTRMCIGRRLAEMEMWQLTCKMLQNFKIEYHHEDIRCHWRLLNVPDKPLRLTLIDLK